MSYPRRKDLFVAWSRAMVEGATVDKPNYRGTKRKSNKGNNPRRRRRMTRRIKRNAKKD